MRAEPPRQTWVFCVGSLALAEYTTLVARFGSYGIIVEERTIEEEKEEKEEARVITEMRRRRK